MVFTNPSKVTQNQTSDCLNLPSCLGLAIIKYIEGNIYVVKINSSFV